MKNGDGFISGIGEGYMERPESGKVVFLRGGSRLIWSKWLGRGGKALALSR
jgi:hypothetical protein